MLYDLSGQIFGTRPADDSQFVRLDDAHGLTITLRRMIFNPHSVFFWPNADASSIALPDFSRIAIPPLYIGIELMKEACNETD